MKDEIKEILDRLERIDHKEYKGGFEFADEADFEEMARCFEERKKLAKILKWYQKENRHNQEIIIKQEKEIDFLKKMALVTSHT